MKPGTNKKIAIIGTAGLPSRYGGFETLTRELVNHLGEEFDFTVYCSKDLYTRSERTVRWKQAKLIYVPLKANGYQSVFYDFFSLIHAIFRCNVLLVLGVSGAIFLPFIRIFTNRKIIIHIDGLEWTRKRWNMGIRFFLKVSEWIAVLSAHSVIADNSHIHEYVSQTYGKSSSLIGYGGDHVSIVSMKESSVNGYPFIQQGPGDKSGGYAISIGRIVPENNIEIVLEAYRYLSKKNLAIIGNWASSRYSKKLRQAYQHCENIFLLNPIYDQIELDMLRSNASLYIHGHSCGGTNPSLVEGMYLGLPVIAHDNPYNLAATENQAFYFNHKEDLIEILENTSPEDLASCAKTLYAIAHEKMKWDDIAKKYADLI